MGRTILIVEDEAPIREGICDLLAYHGHQPTGVGDGERGLTEALTGRYALVILDVMLPGRDGFAICEQLRAARPGQAIMMLTARGREQDVLRGFECGCDDYVPKPFSLSLLRARIEALLRRATPIPATPARASNTLQIGPLSLDLDNLRARVGERDIELTSRDLEVLEYLARERHRVVPRIDLLREVWGYDRAEKLETRCVDMHVVKLRRRLAELLPSGDSPIETVRGVGYRLRVSEDPAG
ncbi:response regulator transcription factor [Enhygromyxa salina]|uniref:response regulator transcription factor n=1 Tax=Enhygromyxa salina TaxID=215803 RepID=UPI001C629B47|nr:response regulator transcription factor [Enhygromyxa salina]